MPSPNPDPDPPIDVTNLTIARYHHELRQQTTTCTAVITAYLARIARYDPALSSVLSINTHALHTAAQKDAETASLLLSGTPFPPLHGVPVILKDNYGTADLPTTAGVRALRTLRTTDCAVVSRLRAAGAIILAKANLHEFALHGTTTSSAGGQTRNPYDLARTPGGSSGGTAAALAAGLALIGCGTDTVNSLRSPASACSIVGFRPSFGEVSCAGIVPVSGTQDVAGPMGRSVADVRALYAAMRGNTARDFEPERGGIWLRIGVLEAYFSLEGESGYDTETVGENATVAAVVEGAVAAVRAAGVDVVRVRPGAHGDWSFVTLQAGADTQAFEFREQVNGFLESAVVVSTPHRSVESIAASGEYDHDAVTEVFTAGLEDPQTFSRSSEAYRTRLENIARLKESVQECFDKNGIDVLLYPHQRQLAVKVGRTRQPNRNGILAALTGRPAICLPGEFRELLEAILVMEWQC
ncbi:hypothetical protein N7462_006148 [Penicillium macrosclerotiorum]|uniref:uncharacterized protein n=1 Tax=Penicillium macrosclerotiorum TaxID=303699 RepID=UPI0025492183|nr:uncharacterized protein N7462_006148 [Penicillium macrosclerotiorum]KAJ5682983.1 hypothetical protein N7462_006148 [Penicillium macrosclerotiorum]